MLNATMAFQYATKHAELVQKFECATMLMNQLVNGKYSSFDVYLNNVTHLRNELNSASSILNRDSHLELYLLEYDAPLFYNLQSLLLTVQMLKNMLDNLAETLLTNRVRT